MQAPNTFSTMKCVLLILPVLIFFSCKSKEEAEKESINRTLKIHLSERLRDFDSTAEIDSIRIIKVDTVSTKDEYKQKILTLQDSLNYLIERAQSTTKILKLSLDQYKALSYLNSLGSSSSDLSIFKDDVKDKQAEAGKAIDLMTALNNEVDSIKKIYFSDKLDSTDFLYYGVTYKICYSDKKLVQKCVDSAYLNITKDFRVKLK